MLLLNHNYYITSIHSITTIVQVNTIVPLWIIITSLLFTINHYESPLNHHPTHQRWPRVSQQAITSPPWPKSTASTGPSPQASKWRNNEPSSATAPRPRLGICSPIFHGTMDEDLWKSDEKPMKNQWKALEMMAKWKKTCENLWKAYEKEWKTTENGELVGDPTWNGWRWWLGHLLGIVDGI